jgi:hypothetical protein
MGMDNKLTVAATAALVTAALGVALFYLSGGELTKEPTTTACDVKVTVTIDVMSINADGTATVRVTPGEGYIYRPEQGLRWVLNSTALASYKFAGNGITFPAGSDPGPLLGFKEKDSEYRWCFAETKKYGKWKYGIRFTRVDPVPLPPSLPPPASTWYCDPTIINEYVGTPPNSASATVVCPKVTS